MASMDNADDLVSVILPAFNSVHFIGDTLRSILAQTHRRIEIIVVDDGSTDGTAGVVETLSQTDQRIRLFRRANHGVPATRNFAAAQAQGTFLAPCDHDDLWRCDKIELQLGALRAAPPGAAVANCWSDGIDQTGAVIFPNWSRSKAEGSVLHEMIESSLPGSGSAPLIPRSCFEDVGGYPENISSGDEWHLYIALAAKYQFVLVPECLVGYRLRTSSLSNDFGKVERSLARTTEWIVATWPQTPGSVLRRRSYTVNCYLSFLATRNRRFFRALRYRLGAWRAYPANFPTLETIGFILMMLGEKIGVQRYYYRAWRKPARWPGATPDRCVSPTG